MLRTEEEERSVLPCYGCWGCDLGRCQCWGLPLLELGACVLPFLVVPLSGVESWKGALPLPTSMQDLGLRQRRGVLLTAGRLLKAAWIEFRIAGACTLRV